MGLRQRLSLSGSPTFSKRSNSDQSSSVSSQYEGGDSQDGDPYGNEQEEQEIDPEDPYMINQLHLIEHDELKVMYQQVVDEILDL